MLAAKHTLMDACCQHDHADAQENKDAKEKEGCCEACPDKGCEGCACSDKPEEGCKNGACGCGN